MLTLSDIERAVNELAIKVNAPQHLLPAYGTSRDGAHPHIEIDNNGLLHYVVVERGVEQSRNSTDDLDELLYFIFSGVTFSMATRYELYHRQMESDSRSLLFSHQEQLMGRLDEKWKWRMEQSHLQTLKKYPLHDPER